jgi:RimJ/RimL family protein N-acetyltransferase
MCLYENSLQEIIYRKGHEIGFIHAFMHKNGIYEIEYGVHEEYRNKGIMKKEFKKFIKKNKQIKKAVLLIHESNIPSQKVAINAGFFEIKFLKKEDVLKYLFYRG